MYVSNKEISGWDNFEFLKMVKMTGTYYVYIPFKKIF